MRKFEYKVILNKVVYDNLWLNNLESTLNTEGGSGWELVSLTTEKSGPDGSWNNVLVFKKEKHALVTELDGDD